MAKISAALARLQQATVQLPLTTRDAPIVLQSAGVDRTFLVSTNCTDPGCAPLLRALRGANLIVRDLTLRAEAAGQGGIGLSGGDEVPERADVFRLSKVPEARVAGGVVGADLAGLIRRGVVGHDQFKRIAGELILKQCLDFRDGGD